MSSMVDSEQKSSPRESESDLAVLYVDDEPKALKYFERYFKGKFSIFTARNAEDAFDILETHHDRIAVLITDHRMPGKKGLQILEDVRERYPDIVRMLTTAYPESGVAIDAINRTEAFRFITKPWDVRELQTSLTQGRSEYTIQKRRKNVLRDRCVLMSKVGKMDQTACLSSLATWAGLNVRNALVPVRKFLDAIPAHLAEEDAGEDALKNPDFWGPSLAAVRRQLDTTNELLTDLYAVSKGEAYRLEDRVDLSELLQEIIDSNSERLKKAEVQIVNNVQRPGVFITADRPKLARMFELLLRRALENGKRGDRITFGTERALDLDVQEEAVRLYMEVTEQMRLLNPAGGETPVTYFDKEAKEAECGLYLLIISLIIFFHRGSFESPPPGGKPGDLAITLPLAPGG